MPALEPVTVTGDANHATVERLSGFSLKEDGSAAAFIRLRVATVSGQIVWEQSFGADESRSVVFDKDDFISTPGGVYLQEASGSVEGVLFDRSIQ